MSLDFCCDIQMVGSEFGIKIMDPSCLVSTVHGGGGVMVWGIFSWHTLGPLVPIEHSLNATAYLSIVADHVHPFMTTVYHLLMATSSRIMHHVTKLKSSQTGFLNMTMSSLYSNGSTVTRSQSNRAGLVCDGKGDSHHGCAADKSAATAWCYHVNMDKISEACFQHLVESIPWRIKAVLKAKKKVTIVTWHTAKYGVGDSYSEFVLCFLTHPKWTHTQSSGQPFMLQHSGSSWGFG